MNNNIDKNINITNTTYTDSNVNKKIIPLFANPLIKKELSEKKNNYKKLNKILLKKNTKFLIY